MKKQLLAILALLTAAACFSGPAAAQTNTPPASPAELEEVYTTALEGRTADILKVLNLTDAAVSNRVHDLIVAQYRALRARDAVIDAKLKVDGKEISYANRASQLVVGSGTLHAQFLAALAADLTPAQVEQVKDKMTYNKVKVTFDAYCAIVPGLTEADKAKMLELLKAAREEAMDGGSAPEKTAIFQKYKDQINDYLNAHGHDVAQAYKVWNAKQAAANAAADKTAPPAK